MSDLLVNLDEIKRAIEVALLYDINETNLPPDDIFITDCAKAMLADVLVHKKEYCKPEHNLLKVILNGATSEVLGNYPKIALLTTGVDYTMTPYEFIRMSETEIHNKFNKTEVAVSRALREVYFLINDIKEQLEDSDVYYDMICADGLYSTFESIHNKLINDTVYTMWFLTELGRGYYLIVNTGDYRLVDYGNTF